MRPDSPDLAMIRERLHLANAFAFARQQEDTNRLFDAQREAMRCPTCGLVHVWCETKPEDGR